MSISITNISSFQAHDPVFRTQTSSQVGTPASQPQADTVRISEEAQAKLLQQQGDSSSTIAETLGLSESTVNDFLDIASGSNAVSPLPAS